MPVRSAHCGELPGSVISGLVPKSAPVFGEVGGVFCPASLLPPLLAPVLACPPLGKVIGFWTAMFEYEDWETKYHSATSYSDCQHQIEACQMAQSRMRVRKGIEGTGHGTRKSGNLRRRRSRCTAHSVRFLLPSWALGVYLDVKEVMLYRGKNRS